MAKVRFLQSTIIVSEDKIYQKNDEKEFKSQVLVDHLLEIRAAELVIEEKTPKKSKSKSNKKAETEANPVVDNA